MKKIVNYKLFNEQRLNRDILKTDVLNENLISNFFAKIFKSSIFTKLKWAKNFIDKIIKNKIRPIGSGTNAGKPSAFLFLPENGDLFTQFTSIYKLDDDLGSAIAINESLELNEDLSHLKSKSKNISNIGSAELIDLLEETYENDLWGHRKSIFIYGAPGIGKTKIITEASKRIGGDIIFMDLQFYNPDDFAGIPAVRDVIPHGYKSRQEIEDEKIKKVRSDIRQKIEDEKIKKGRPDIKSIKVVQIENGEEVVYDYGEGFTRKNLPTIFPREGDARRGIIFMDEMNRANTYVLNSLMTFLGDGRNIENYTLPLGWIIVAAGNRKWDDPEFFDQIADITGDPFIQRFEPYNYLPSYDEWAKWARKENVLPELIDWLELPNVAEEWWHRPYTKETSSNLEYDKGTPWASPRSWTELAAKLALKCKRENVPILIPIEDNIIPKLPGEIQKSKLKKMYFTALVGFDAATAFMDYLDIITKVTLPQRQEIYATPTLAPIPDSMKDANGKISSSVFCSVTRFLLKHCEVPNDSAQTITNVAHTLVWANKIRLPEMSTFLLRISKEIYPQLDKSKLNHITEEIQDIFYEYVDDPEDPAQTNPTVTYGAPKPVDYICGKILKRINSDYPNETDWDIEYVKRIRAIVVYNLIEENGKGNLGDKLRSFKQNRLNRKK